MVNVHRGHRQIFQFGHRRVQAVAQRHGSSRAPGGGQQFTGFFADLNGLPAMYSATVASQIKTSCRAATTHLPRSKFRRSPSTSSEVSIRILISPGPWRRGWRQFHARWRRPGACGNGRASRRLRRSCRFFSRDVLFQARRTSRRVVCARGIGGRQPVREWSTGSCPLWQRSSHGNFPIIKTAVKRVILCGILPPSLLPCHPSRFPKELPPELVEHEDSKDKQPVSPAVRKSLFEAMREAVGCTKILQHKPINVYRSSRRESAQNSRRIRMSGLTSAATLFTANGDGRSGRNNSSTPDR